MGLRLEDFITLGTAAKNPINRRRFVGGSMLVSLRAPTRPR